MTGLVLRGSWVHLLLTLTLLAGGAMAQVGMPPRGLSVAIESAVSSLSREELRGICETNYVYLDPTIVLDSTGVTSWKFLNPRRPAAVLKEIDNKAKKAEYDYMMDFCALGAEVVFQNASSAEAFVVTFPYTYEEVDRAKALAVLSKRAQSLIAPCNPPGGPPAAWCAPAQEIVRLLSGPAPGGAGSGGAPLSDEAMRVVRATDDLTDRPKVQKALRKLAAIQEVYEKLKVFKAAEGAAKPPAGAKEIASRLEQDFDRFLRSGRGRAEALPPIADCPAALAGSQGCKHAFTVVQGTRHSIDFDTWQRLARHSSGRLDFTVAFFDEATPPSSNRGFLRVKSRAPEAKSRAAWTVIGSVEARREPGTDRDPADAVKDYFSPLAPQPVDGDPPADDPNRGPYSGSSLERFPAVGRLQLEQTLGDRAYGKVIGQFKKGDLGESDQSGEFNVIQWEASVFGLAGTALRFGRRAFAAPASAIAINESGEGVTASFRSFSVSRLLKKEGAAGLTDDLEEDSASWVAELRNQRLDFGVLRYFDAYYVAGEERKKGQRPYDYWTWGAQLFFAFDEVLEGDSDWFISGKAASFVSDRSIEASFESDEAFSEVLDGEGRAWLLEIDFNQVEIPATAGKQAKGLRAFGVRVGEGTGDDPSTPDVDEGYIGENAAFTPDNLFLRRFSGLLRNATGETGDGATDELPDLLVAKGLSNKRYYGLTYTERGQGRSMSPLYWLSKLLRADADVATATFTVRGHWYRFDRPVLGKHDAGFEYGLEWLLEAPKGAKWTLSYGRYEPGEALDSLFESAPEFISAGVALTLK